ncbi:unnamed protein product [Rotaria sp. Silwood2]|nr:unnamed protein product [Rotaria sp. Silwood2]CAF2926367.1 unnamed protein product [Rotaria sp. Silwood2]CAF2992147.1 unnamed protein product [Rotaria sp. Silwood2]CAF3091378.1 unnamed protein product [Rotaria sp. Silwood2]CAF4086004.1 unnamed protein product [Rotaria sp. Silwood2]
MMMTCFDDLNIDLLMEIFDYLSFTELFRAFFGLNQRLNNIIRHYPAYFDLSTIRNCNIFYNDAFKCRSLKVSSSNNEDEHDNLYSYLNFSTIRAVTFQSINLRKLLSFIQQLPMQQLESIKVTKMDSSNCAMAMHEEVWLIILAAGRNRLRCLHVPYQFNRWNIDRISFDLPSIEYITLESIRTDQMLILLRHTPNLGHLKAHLLGFDWGKHLSTFNTALPKLKHMNLSIQYLRSFELLHHFFISCPHLIHLILKLKAREDTKMIVDPRSWQTLIEQYLPDLQYLRLRLNIFLSNGHKRHNIQSPFDRAKYWLERQPHFQVIVKRKLHPWDLSDI